MHVKNSNIEVCKIKIKLYPLFPHSLTVISNNGHSMGEGPRGAPCTS